MTATVTPEQDAIIRKMGAAHASVADISAATMCSRGVVRRYMAKHDMARRTKDWSPVSAEAREQVLALFAQGMTRQEVRKRFGFAQATLTRIKDGAGVPRVRVLWTEEERVALRQMAADQVPPRDICKKLGRSYSSVSAQVTLLGLVLGARLPRSDEKVAQVRDMAARAMTDRQIGEAIGLAARTVRALRKDNGIPSVVPVSARGSRAKKRAKPVVAPPSLPADAPGIVNGYRLAGWPEIRMWWLDHGGKGWPEIGAVNELRRKNGRHPFKPMAGKWSPITAGRAAA